MRIDDYVTDVAQVQALAGAADTAVGKAFLAASRVKRERAVAALIAIGRSTTPEPLQALRWAMELAQADWVLQLPASAREMVAGEPEE